MNLTWKDLGVAGDATALIVHGLNRWGGADVHRLDLYVRMAEASAGDDCSKSNHCLYQRAAINLKEYRSDD
jgi:hypothetical protein